MEEIKNKLKELLDIRILRIKDWNRAEMRIQREYPNGDFLEILEKFQFEILLFMPKNINTNAKKIDYLLNKMSEAHKNNYIKITENDEKLLLATKKYFVPNTYLLQSKNRKINRKKSVFEKLEE